MRHAAVASILLLVTGPLTATAQTMATEDAPVQAAVALRPISMTRAGITDFGIVTGADVANVTGTAVISPNAPGLGQSTAMFSISGEPNTGVTVTCGAPAFLFLNTDPSHSMTFEGVVAHSTDQTNQGGARAECFGGSGTFSAMLSGTGDVHAWLGGQLRVRSHNPPTAGAYSGTYKLVVSY
jgi:hypothetical protein